MDSKELRIGNLVCWADEPSDELPLTVMGAYSENDVWVEWTYSDGKIDSDDCKLNSIRPIELSEEWLLRLNFKKDGDTIFRYPLGGSILIVLFKKEGIQVGIVYNGAISGGSINLPHIKYLHQVQNLIFDLTGKELEFTL